MSDIKNLPVLPAPAEFNMLKEMAKMGVNSGLLPTSIKTPEQAMIISLKGRELGIPPMQAFSHINVINGKPTMSAELMLSMIYKNVPGAIVDFLETNEKKCLIEAKRPNGKRTKFSFTIEEAQQAGLLGKDPWKKYPAAMLRARAISIMARALFPDALNGVSYTPEELGSDVELNEDGSEEIKEVKSEVVQTKTPTQKMDLAVEAFEHSMNKWTMDQQAKVELITAMQAAKWTPERMTHYISEHYAPKTKSFELDQTQYEELKGHLYEIAKGIESL